MSLSIGLTKRQSTMPNFNTTSKMLMYANAFICSCAMIQELYGTTIIEVKNASIENW